MSFHFPDIPSKYRPAPFWSWNADLKPDELRWQIREMHKAGMGGFFMHARGGLQTAYLSKEWMDCVNASLDEARQLGMDAWLYDENGWPSGFGGGLVNGLGPVYQAKYLRHEFISREEAQYKENTIGFYTVSGETFLGTDLTDNAPEKVLRCYYELNPYYVDNLDAKVVAEFIRVTHEFYYKNIPAELLSHLRGIFTDEPQLSRNGLVWSLVLADEWKKIYNDDLILLLPGLFLELPHSANTRIRFWKLCSDLFSKAFMKQIRDWCQEHNWELTGHQVMEEALAYQTESNGSIMPQYRYYTLPGVDCLGRRQLSDVTCLQLVSVAAQYGQKQLLTESFALTGWACNFSGMRWVYQRQLAHGINYLCQHLQSYSLRGNRKRDYPQSSFYHQPWWEDYHVLNDYFSRVGMILATGNIKVDTLVLHPVSSIWKLFIGVQNFYNHPFQSALENISGELSSRMIPHHYADEIIVDECGSVENGKFIIGQCAYNTVIIPQLSNISRKIFNLLQKFHRQHGTLLRIKPSVNAGQFTIDGIPADQFELDFLSSLPAFDSESAAAEYVAGKLPELVSVTENGVPVTKLYSTWRDTEINGIAGRFHYFVNTDYISGSQVEITLPYTGKNVAVIDQLTGEFFRPENIRYTDSKTVINYNFGAADALMLFVSEKLETSFLPQLARIAADAMPIRLLPEKSWQIARMSDNIFTLDHCRYRVDNGQWQEGDTVDIQVKLLALERSCNVELEFDFFADEDFDLTQKLDLAVELPELYSFALNGQTFAIEKNGYLFDKAFERIVLPDNFRHGINTLNMKLHFEQYPETYDTIRKARIFESEYNKLTLKTEIESIYICGNFSVRHTGQVIALDKNASRFRGKFSLGAPLKGDIVNCRNLTIAGMPFFAGKITLRNSFTLTAEEVSQIRFLSCDLCGSNSIKARINGIECQPAFWEPFAIDVKGKLQQGINTIEIDLVMSLRNMLGPHHLIEGESYVVHTLSFNREQTILYSPPPSTPEFCFLDSGIKNIRFTN